VLERLDILLDVDTRSRWRIILISALAISVSGFVGERAGERVRDAQVAAAVIGLIVFCSQTFLYTLSPGALRASFSVQRRTYLLRSAVTIAASAMLAIVASVSAPLAQAAALNRRLREALAHPDGHAARAAGQILFYAAHSQAQPRIDLVTRLAHEYAHIAVAPERGQEAAWDAYVAALNYIVNWRAARRDPETLQASMRALDSVKNAPVCGPNNEALMVSEAWARKGQWLSVEALKEWPNGLHDCRLVIDGKNLFDVLLFNVIVEYHGGPATLNNVRFLAANFQLDNTPNARKLAEALLQSDKNVVTLTLE
jgi:hypothetical protein